MRRDEFLMWIAFYKLYPFDDRHRYHRPHALLASAFNGKDVKDYLEWLQPSIAQSTNTNGAYSDADLKTMAAFGIKPPAE